MQFLTRRWALLAAATALLAPGLTVPVIAQDEVSLTVWTDTPRQSMFEEYDRQHDNVSLDISVQGADIVQKIQLALRSGSGIPDVIFMADVSWGAQLKTRRTDYLLTLDDLVPQEVRDEFYPNSNSPCLLNGELVCLRNDMAHFIVWYDAPLMEELGVEVPTTWEEFEALGAELAPQGYILGSGVESYPLVNYLTSAGCEMALPDPEIADALHINLSTEACTKPAGMVDRMLANGSLSRLGTFEPDLINLAKERRIPLLIGPTWFGEYVIKPSYEVPAGRLAAATSLRWEDQEQPLAWSWGGGTYGGYQGTAHPEIVADILMWMSTDVGIQTDAITLPAHRPSSLAWGEKLKTDEYYANDDVFDIQVEAAQYSNPGYSSLRLLVDQAVAKIVGQALGSGGTIEGALPALEAELVNLAQLNGYQVISD